MEPYNCCKKCFFFYIFKPSVLVHYGLARWFWDGASCLHRLSTVNITGSGTIHLDGVALTPFTLLAAAIIGPRLGRWDFGDLTPMGSPTSALIGLFVLWIGWQGHNYGSHFNLTFNQRRLVAIATGQTMVGTFGGRMLGS